jgi:hypothetical protein
MDIKAIVSITLSVIMLVSVGGIMWNRIKIGGGITWSIIRFCTITIALPLAGLLALNGVLSEATSAIIGGALGYAFGKSDDGEAEKQTPKLSESPPA